MSSRYGQAFSFRVYIYFINRIVTKVIASILCAWISVIHFLWDSMRNATLWNFSMRNSEDQVFLEIVLKRFTGPGF